MTTDQTALLAAAYQRCEEACEHDEECASVSDMEPDDWCSACLLQGVLELLAAQQAALEKILERAVATCEREGFGIDDTDDMIAIRGLTEKALR